MRFIKAVVFFLFLFILSATVSGLLQPIWIEWNNYDTIHGFYQEQQDTIETVFLGSSVIINAIAPTELYEQYGICAYNLGTEQQPMMASYHWLKEAYRLHANTLNTVILDASMLRRVPAKEFYQKAFDGLRISKNKMEAIREYTSSIDGFIDRFIPLMEYHDRWPELSQESMARLSAAQYTRGFNAVTGQVQAIHSRADDVLWQYLDNDEYQFLALPSYYFDSNAEPIPLDPEAIEYYTKIVDFCEQHALKLILIKTPTLSWAWDDAAHIAVANLAEDSQIPFLDFNYGTLSDELHMEYTLDLTDNHMNYFGAHKLTKWMGYYLINQCGNRDVRGDERYAYMDKQLVEYQGTVERSAFLQTISDVSKYLSEAMTYEHCILFLSVMDDASGSLTAEQRGALAALGLEKLSKLGYRDSYLAVIREGNVFFELTDLDKVENSETPFIKVNGQVCGVQYKIASGGLVHGNISSILIDGNEYSAAMRGINIVVYDYQNRNVVDATSFDTCGFSTREADIESRLIQARENGTPWYELPERIRKVWLYDRRFDNSKYESYWNLFCSRDQLFEYLSPYVQNKDYTIYIAVQDDAANSFDDATRAAFAALGLTELSQLQFRDSYIGIIDDGAVYFEQRDHGESPITYNGIDFHIASGGLDSGNCSEIFIHDRDCSWHWRGLNIVVYDKELQSVISQIAFDTCETPIDLSASEGRDDAA